MTLSSSSSNHQFPLSTEAVQTGILEKLTTQISEIKALVGWQVNEQGDLMKKRLLDGIDKLGHVTETLSQKKGVKNKWAREYFPRILISRKDLELWMMKYVTQEKTLGTLCETILELAREMGIESIVKEIVFHMLEGCLRDTYPVEGLTEKYGKYLQNHITPESGMELISRGDLDLEESPIFYLQSQTLCDFVAQTHIFQGHLNKIQFLELQSVDLARYTPVVIENVMKCFPNLKILVIKWSDFDILDIDQMRAFSKHLRGIEALHISNRNLLRDCPVDVVKEFFGNVSGIKILSFDKGVLDECDGDKIDPVFHRLSKLKSCSFKFNSLNTLSEDTVNKLFGFLEGVEEINLEYTKLFSLPLPVIEQCVEKIKGVNHIIFPEYIPTVDLPPSDFLRIFGKFPVSFFQYGKIFHLKHDTIVFHKLKFLHTLKYWKRYFTRGKVG